MNWHKRLYGKNRNPTRKRGNAIRVTNQSLPEKFALYHELISSRILIHVRVLCYTVTQHIHVNVDKFILGVIQRLELFVLGLQRSQIVSVNL